MRPQKKGAAAGAMMMATTYMAIFCPITAGGKMSEMVDGGTVCEKAMDRPAKTRPMAN